MKRSFLQQLCRCLFGGAIVWALCAAALIPAWAVTNATGVWIFWTVQP